MTAYHKLFQPITWYPFYPHTWFWDQYYTHWYVRNCVLYLSQYFGGHFL